MKTTSCLAVAALVAAASTPALAAPLEAYGSLPSIEQVAISADGKDLALIATNGEQRALVVEAAADQKPFAVIKLGDAKLRAIEWVGDHHVLMTISVHGMLQSPYGPMQDAGLEHLVALDYDLADQRQTFLMNDVPKALNIVYGEPLARIIDGLPVAYLVGQIFLEGEPRGRIVLLRADLDAHATKVVDLGLPHVNDWAVDAQGRPLAVTAYDAPSATWTLRMREGDGWRVLKTLNAPIERPELDGLGRDGRSLLIADWVDNERVFREVAPDAADWGAPIAHGERDGIHDPATHALIGFASLDGDIRNYSFFDAKDQATWQAVQAAYPGQQVQLVSASDNRRKLVVLVDSPTDGPAYALVDLDTGAAGWIDNAYDGLKAGDLSERRAIAFKAADGLALTGYLTLPQGRPEKALPLVALVHGGPAARDEPGFDWWAQALASRGYAVLQVNYRGSDGFGWNFLSAGFGQWGRKMQTDVSDGVRYLAAQGRSTPSACASSARAMAGMRPWPARRSTRASTAARSRSPGRRTCTG